MTLRQAVLVALLVVVAIAVGLPAVSAQETATPTATNTTEDLGANETDDQAGLGTQLTAFLQSSSATANDTVENGMWKASFEQANESDRARLVTKRAGTLEQRLERLQARNETLNEQYENGSLRRPAYVAQQSQLAGRINALQAAVNDTDTAATQAGVEDARLERLKQDVRTMRGPQVAGVARGLGGGPPADRGGGPPEAKPGESGPPETGPGGEASPAGNETRDDSDTGSQTNSDDGKSPSNPAGAGEDNAGTGGSGAGSAGPSGSGTPPIDFVTTVAGDLLSVFAS